MAAVGMGTVVLSLAEMASMFVPIRVIHAGALTDQGPLLPVVNTTGYPNMHLQAYRSS